MHQHLPGKNYQPDRINEYCRLNYLYVFEDQHLLFCAISVMSIGQNPTRMYLHWN